MLMERVQQRLKNGPCRGSPNGLAGKYPGRPRTHSLQDSGLAEGPREGGGQRTGGRT